ncbi:hypothetical protein WA026_012712 [Henosepilachna vigintioctopunctata]|uniref:Uncharacterized protein n=1 Tax=Henosepilachna vigintioctopunctata TaxID=420089 RepID=A0AAW1TXT2_9CUCU
MGVTWEKSSSEEFWSEVCSPIRLQEVQLALTFLRNQEKRSVSRRGVSIMNLTPSVDTESQEGMKSGEERPPSKRRAFSSPKLRSTVEYEERIMNLHEQIIVVKNALEDMNMKCGRERIQ